VEFKSNLLTSSESLETIRLTSSCYSCCPGCFRLENSQEDWQPPYWGQQQMNRSDKVAAVRRPIRFETAEDWTVERICYRFHHFPVPNPKWHDSHPIWFSLEERNVAETSCFQSDSILNQNSVVFLYTLLRPTPWGPTVIEAGGGEVAEYKAMERFCEPYKDPQAVHRLFPPRGGL